MSSLHDSKDRSPRFNCKANELPFECSSAAKPCKACFWTTLLDDDLSACFAECLSSFSTATKTTDSVSSYNTRLLSKSCCNELAACRDQAKLWRVDLFSLSVVGYARALHHMCSFVLVRSVSSSAMVPTLAGRPVFWWLDHLSQHSSSWFLQSSGVGIMLTTKVTQQKTCYAWKSARGNLSSLDRKCTTVYR